MRRRAARLDEVHEQRPGRRRIEVGDGRLLDMNRKCPQCGEPLDIEPALEHLSDEPLDCRCCGVTSQVEHECEPDEHGQQSLGLWLQGLDP